MKKFLFSLNLFVLLLLTLLLSPAAFGADWKIGTNASTLLVIPAGTTSASAFTNVTGAVINTYPGRGLSLMVSSTAAEKFNSNNIVYFNVSQDGTNFTSTLPLQFQWTNDGTTNVIAYTNFTDTVLSNIKAIRVGRGVTTQTNAVTINYLRYGAFY